MNFPYAHFRWKPDPGTGQAVFNVKTDMEWNSPVPALGANMAETRDISIH
jgi:hypothetical protein